jgi:3-phosphoshikimate 1-carboxyvinyltransferase
MLALFGADISAGDGVIRISSHSDLSARDISIPSDVSSAAFFGVAAASLKGSDLIMNNIGVNPTRTAAFHFLSETGAAITYDNQRIVSNEPVADIRITAAGILGSSAVNRISGGRIANLIDEIPILAVYGTQLEGGLEIREAKELRVKESDRIRSVVINLRKMGAEVEEFEDGMRIERSKLKGNEVDSYGDHRIAMAFAIAGLLAEGETTIHGAECVDISFPGFFGVLEEVVER